MFWPVAIIIILLVVGGLYFFSRGESDLPKELMNEVGGSADNANNNDRQTLEAGVDVNVDGANVSVSPDGRVNADVGGGGIPQVKVNVGANGVSTSVSSQSVSPKTFVVEGDNYTFSLKEIRVPIGTPVTIVFKNKEGLHDLKIDEFAVATKKISAGAEEKVSFVANKKGSFEYYCSVGQHRANGMFGKLVVE